MLIKELLHFNLLEINTLNSLKNKNEEQDKEKDEEKEKERSRNRVRRRRIFIYKGMKGLGDLPRPIAFLVSLAQRTATYGSQGGEHELGTSS